MPAVARAEVVSQEILELDMTLSNVVWAGGTGGGAPTARHLRNRGARPLVCNRRHLALRSYMALRSPEEE